MKTFLVIVSILALGLSFSACGNDITSPTPTGTAGYTLFHSDRYDISVQLPSGWAAAEGPGDLGIIHQVGLMSFNSWGEAGFWAQATREDMPDGSISLHYSTHIVASQIPAGGAYIALLELGGPPPVDQQVTEYTLNDLSGLYEPHDWRQENYGSYADAYFKTFFIGGSSLALEVACSQNATDETVNQINDLLQSWRFNSLPIDSLGAISCQSNQQPIEVESVKMVETPLGPDGEINPGGAHIIEITLNNAGQEPVVYLRATLILSTWSTDTSGNTTEEQYSFDSRFDIKPVNPLLPGESRSGTCDIPGYIPILNNIMYPLKLHITFQNETLDYMKQVQITES